MANWFHMLIVYHDVVLEYLVKQLGGIFASRAGQTTYMDLYKACKQTPFRYHCSSKVRETDPRDVDRSSSQLMYLWRSPQQHHDYKYLN